MRGKKTSEEEIIKVLKEVDAGLKPKEACRKHGISEGTLYKWKRKFQGMEVADAKKLRALEQENAKLKRIIGDMTVDIAALKDINSRKW
jgi:putative transposase